MTKIVIDGNLSIDAQYHDDLIIQMSGDDLARLLIEELHLEPQGDYFYITEEYNKHCRVTIEVVDGTCGPDARRIEVS